MSELGRKLVWPFWDEYGPRAWFVVLLACVVLAAICVAILWAAGAFNGHACNPPNHLVYVGWHYVMVGKVLIPMNEYDCVAS